MRLKIILFFFITNLFSQSSDSIYISSLKDYPLNKEVKIFYDKQWRPVTEIDSASYYRLVTFEMPNVPKGRVDDYFMSGKMQSNFYARYVGLSSKKIDSVVYYGPAEYYFEDPNIIEYERNYFNNKLVGNYKEYHYSGELSEEKYYIDGLQQGKETSYYDSPEKLIAKERTYVNDTVQGKEISYYESGNIEYELEYIDGLAQGKQTIFFDSPEKLIDREINFVNNILEGEVIAYYESGNIRYEYENFDGFTQGKQTFYYDSPSKQPEWIRNWVNDTLQGESTQYFESGKISAKYYFKDGLKHGKIQYSENGDVTKNNSFWRENSK